MIGVAIGDLHFDALTKYWPEANSMQADCVRQVATRAKTEDGATHLVLLGDIAEGIKDATGSRVRLSEDGQQQFFRLLTDLSGMFERVDVIAGNHDFSSSRHTALDLFSLAAPYCFSNVHVHTEPGEWVVDKTSLVFLPHPHRQTLPGAHLTFAHYEVNGAKMDNGRLYETEAEDDATGLFIQGHLHTKQKVRNHYYPGTLYQCNFGEHPKKGYAVFKTYKGKVVIEPRPYTPPFTLVNLEVTSKEGFSALTANPLTLFKLFVHESVRVPPTLLADYPNIVNALEFKDAEELEKLQEVSLHLAEGLVDLSVDTVLPEFLKAKGLTQYTIDRALSIHRNLTAVK